MRPIKGERYATRDGVSVGLVDFIVSDLPFLSYEKATAFYAEAVPRMSLDELALLGCNDRFFLLTGLLNRADAIHPWLYDRCREVEADPDGYIDLWARYHYKSTIITFAGNIQDVACDPEITIGIFGNTKAISRPFLSQIMQELEQNPFLQQVYDDVFWQDPRKNAPVWSLERGIVVKRKGNPKESTVEAHGLIDGMPTGRHFAKMVYDDMVTESSVTNPDQIRKTTERFELSTNLATAGKTRRQIAGTRYNFADTLGIILERGIAQPRLYPATDDGTLKGQPVFLTAEKWEEIKATQRSTVAAQMLQNPLAGSENTFRVEWLRPYELRPARMNVYIMGDPSKGRSKKSDRTAIVAIGVDSGKNRYLLDGYCHRMPPSERWEKLRDLWKKWSTAPGVEFCKVGWETYGLQADHEYFAERMEIEKVHFPIAELNWVRDAGAGGQSKRTRVERLEPYFRTAKFHMPFRVWHAGIGDAVWAINEARGVIQYRAYDGPTRQEQEAVARGERHRVIQPVARKDEDGSLYDLFSVFAEEFAFFPFSTRDDLIDATSRIEDMEPTAPMLFEDAREAAAVPVDA